MAQSYASLKKIVLKIKLSPGDSSFTADRDIGVTKGRILFKSSTGATTELISFSGVASSGSNYVYSSLTRDLSDTTDPATSTSTGETWKAGSTGYLVAMHDQIFDRQNPRPTTFATTAARDSALGADGAATEAYVNIYVTATGLHYNYNLSTNQWESLDTGTVTPNASTTVAGKVEIGTQTQVDNSTDTGETGAYTVVIPSTMQTGITNRVATQAQTLTGTNDTQIITPLKLRQSMQIGDGSDGAISGAVTVTGSNNTYIVKQYTTFAPGANTVTITPTGCILHIKVQGDCNLTGTTFAFNGKGGPKGAGGASGSGGTSGTAGITNLPGLTLAGIGVGGVSAPNKGTGGAKLIHASISYASIVGGGTYLVSCGAGGGGGAGGQNAGGGSGGTGGDGGDGGGAFILEVGGNLTLSSTTITVAGSNGSVGQNGTTRGGGGGGAGGGGGTCIILYRGALTGTVTPTVTGGTGAAGGSGDTWNGGGGGGGGASLITAGTDGTDGSVAPGGTGGNGGVGTYVIKQYL